MRPFLILCTFTSLCLSAFAGDKSIDAQIDAATLVKVGQMAPDFACKTIDGRPFKLSDQKGKVVILYFFASSAPFSITEMKYLETDVFQKLRDRDDFLMLGIGRGHEREAVMKIGGKNGLTFSLADDANSEVSGRYFSKFLPRTVVLRRDGTIGHLSHGYHEYGGVVALQAVLEKELGAAAR